ncbi:latrophilin Cirl [Photinus pyralis]|uniref:latrophilin Cirl n=1 Tax=Photinus pyralis TaxID=7054 RepID=UPI00126710F9|nr:latrophilin Cirl [Photinus pyralis]
MFFNTRTIYELGRYETAYACEGKTLKIECKDGELIKLIRANYGRFSITICNDHGNTDWSVNCMSPKSLRVLHNRCSQVQNCSIPASTNMFGDPCPGTLKYLEAHYQCLSAATTTTTNRPSPPWLITSQPPVWSTVKPTARPPPPLPKVSPTVSPKSTAITSSTQTTTASHSPQPLPVEPVLDDINVKSKTSALPDEITTILVTASTPKKGDNMPSFDYNPISSNYPPQVKDVDSFNYCSPVTIRSIYWNWTRAGELIIQPCPGGTTGFARWRCASSESDTAWSPQTPDLSECRSVWLTSLEQRLLMGRDPLTSIISDLAQVTSSKTLYGGDMMITTKIIQNMAHKMSMDIQTFPDPRQREAIVTEMLNDVVRTGSNLLDSSQHPSWRDLSHKEQMRVATSLLIGLEENAFLLADTVIREKTVDQIVKNIMLSVRVLETRNVHIERFPSDNKWSSSNDSIELPRGALLENSEGGFVRLVFVAFDRLEEILQWQPDSFDDNFNKNVSRMLNSKVISASLGKGRHIQLYEPVRLTLKHLKVENVSNPSCVFWDYTTSTWSEEGCHVYYTNETHTICECDHLTNFAILMDVHSTYLPAGHQIALQIITYVGCIISVVCLVLAIITFQLFRGLKSDRTTIHCNLCVCLLIAELLFLVGIDQTDNRLGCGFIAAFLHYFFLCAFVWMFFEGFQLYVMLIEVFESEKSRLRWYYFIAYGLPLLIVSISGAVFPTGYGTSRYCWLRADNYFIYSFVGPVIVVIILNLVFLSMAIVMMCRHSNASVSMKNKEHSRLASVSGKEENALQTKFQAHLSWLRGAIILVFLLGLTWTFGFLYLDRESVAMAYIFSVLNSLQGFFIFIFHYVQNEKVRKEYRKFIRRHSWLPKCLRCSKMNTGAGSSSGSTGLGKERRASLYIGSNGNPSAPNSHSTDNSVLSPHGTSLQRGWSSRSCNSMNRVGKSPVPTSTSTGMATTLCHTHRPSSTTPPPVLEPPNTSTLPYIRNFYKISTHNPNLPKSASTWGPLNKPLHWKNISFKSCSRDSGHGGSEQEDSPRLHTVILDTRLNNCKDMRRQSYVSAELNNALSNNLHQVDFDNYADSVPHQKHLQLPQNLQPNIMRKKNGNFLRSASPWNHTYTEIQNGRMRGLVPEDDPVYEEIERNEIQVSDMSDEDGKRQSDMSRQSSRSYGDHRPLIPYSPATDRSIHSCLEAVTKHRLKEPNRYTTDIEDYRMSRQHLYRGDAARSLAAVLDGETVICHLEPPEMYPHDPYSSRTLVLPQYSES